MFKKQDFLYHILATESKSLYSVKKVLGAKNIFALNYHHMLSFWGRERDAPTVNDFFPLQLHNNKKKIFLKVNPHTKKTRCCK